MAHTTEHRIDTDAQTEREGSTMGIYDYKEEQEQEEDGVLATYWRIEGEFSHLYRDQVSIIVTDDCEVIAELGVYAYKTLNDLITWNGTSLDPQDLCEAYPEGEALEVVIFSGWPVTYYPGGLHVARPCAELIRYAWEEIVEDYHENRKLYIPRDAQSRCQLGWREDMRE